jgi:hypothetical protein
MRKTSDRILQIGIDFGKLRQRDAFDLLDSLLSDS